MDIQENKTSHHILPVTAVITTYSLDLKPQTYFSIRTTNNDLLDNINLLM